MTSQKPHKPAREMTTEEAIRELFPPKVVKHAKERADEAEHIPSAKRLPKSMPKE